MSPTPPTTVQLLIDGAWLDITALGKVYTRNPITLASGRANMAAWLKPRQRKRARSSGTGTIRSWSTVRGQCRERNPASSGASVTSRPYLNRCSASMSGLCPSLRYSAQARARS